MQYDEFSKAGMTNLSGERAYKTKRNSPYSKIKQILSLLYAQ